jgi:hypothetical protein
VAYGPKGGPSMAHTQEHHVAHSAILLVTMGPKADPKVDPKVWTQK